MREVKSVIGLAIPRVEGAEKVAGKALYAADVHPPGTLWGKVLRSPYPHARITRIDATRALKVEGVRAVLTGNDIPHLLMGKTIRDMPVLCWDKVRFIGDRVAAAAADTEEAAEQALERIEVDYQELPAVFDPLAAMEPDAPRIHDNVASYEGAPPEILIPEVPNGLTRLIWSKGDVERGFQSADIVMEHTFRIPIRHQGYLEPHASMVALEDGHVHAWICTKSPFSTRTQLARTIGVDEKRIRIHAVNVGGDFGGKGGVTDLPIAYFLAQRAGRPVKIPMSFSEELAAGNPSHPSIITVRTGVNRDGRMVARHLRAVHASGAYGGQKPFRASIAGAGTAGPYRIDNTFLEAVQVYTNSVPCGFWRAPGALQAIFAVESHMDLIADEIKMDRAEFRLKNIITEGEENALGVTMQGVNARATLQAAMDACGWNRPKPRPNYGRGIAMYERFTGAGPIWAVLRAEADGTLTLLTVSGDQGTGLRTVLCQTVAEEMQVPIERVRVLAGDTDAVCFNIDIGFGGSRSTNIGGHAVIRACRDLLARLVSDAAQLLGCSETDVDYAAGRFWHRNKRRTAISLGQVVAKTGKGEPVTVATKLDIPMQRSSTSFVAQAAEVEVDRETGHLKLHRFVSAHDVGTIINPLAHQGQVDGGVLMGIGAALIEELAVKDGQVTTPHLGDYKLPNIADIPDLRTVLVPAPSGPGPYEAKAIGEMANVSPPAAIANALADAVGVRLFDLPMTSEKIYNALLGRSR